MKDSRLHNNFMLNRICLAYISIIYYLRIINLVTITIYNQII